VDLDETKRRLVWAITDAPFQLYNATAQVFNDASGQCRFAWTVDLLPNELKDRVAAMMDQGLAAISKTLQHQ
jgi:hypothetical protein